jgi:large subunit ribosomal protein L4
MQSALSLFRQEKRLVVLKAFALPEPKTRQVQAVVERFDVGRGVIVDLKVNEDLRRAARNLPRVLFLPPEGLNVYDLLRADQLLVTRAGVGALVEAFKPAPRRAARPAAGGK